MGIENILGSAILFLFAFFSATQGAQFWRFSKTSRDKSSCLLACGIFAAGAAFFAYGAGVLFRAGLASL